LLEITLKMRRSPVQRPGRVGRYLRFEIRSVVLFTSLILVVEIVGIFSCTGGRSGAPRATRPSYRDAGARGGDAPGDRYGTVFLYPYGQGGTVFSLAGLLPRGRQVPCEPVGFLPPAGNRMGAPVAKDESLPRW